MAFSCPNVVISLSPAPGKLPRIKSQRRIAVPKACKARVDVTRVPSLPTFTSRRDAIICLTASLATSLFATDPAEAHLLKPEIMQMIMEKLQLLQEKAGILKQKTDSSSSNEEKLPPSDKNSIPTEDRMKPGTGSSPAGPVVETDLAF